MTAPLSGPIDEVTVRVLAPNPSPMTLDGTNTYLLGRSGVGEVVVVDPGPDLAEHRAAIESAVENMDAAIVAVVVTHSHRDHAEAASWATIWQAPLYAFDPVRVPGAVAFGDGARLQRGGIELRGIHTPGHASDHVCLQVVDTGAVLAGDHVLGRGTSVVAWPDGDLGDYLQSLQRLARELPTRLDPGHGPSLTDPAATIATYLDRRSQRDQQILDAVRAGASTPRQIVMAVYADVDPDLHPAAERSVRAHLRHLAAGGRLSPRDGWEDASPQLLPSHLAGRDRGGDGT